MISYYLIVPFLYLLSYLPSSVLYKLADVVAFVLRSVIGYRRDVVYTNLRNSFPEKSEEEIQQIAKQSYTHLADRVVENIKSITITDAEFLHRCKIDDESKAILNQYYKQERDIVVMVAHAGAWEYAGYTAGRDTPYTIYGVYSPVKNKYFNRLIVETRGKIGMVLISMKSTSEYFKTKITERNMHIFFTDQSPSNPANAYWTTFLNQDTGFFYGAARYAIKHNCVVIYAHVKQVARGHYRIHVTPITEDAQNKSADEIVQRYTELLEQQLKSFPTDWLWSHKRWKRKRPVELGGNRAE